MKPHKHAEIIKAWADGAEIEYFDTQRKRWITCFNNTPCWEYAVDYRIKPEPKPDVVKYYNKEYLEKIRQVGRIYTCPEDALILIWDGETGELKSAKVIK